MEGRWSQQPCKIRQQLKSDGQPALVRGEQICVYGTKLIIWFKSNTKYFYLVLTEPVTILGGVEEDGHLKGWQIYYLIQEEITSESFPSVSRNC